MRSRVLCRRSSTGSTYDSVPRDGAYVGEIVELGCVVSGFTLDELREAVEETISLYLDAAPKPVRVDELLVAV